MESSFECIGRPAQDITHQHFHAYYQENAAIFRIDPIELIEGMMPKKQTRLLEAWAELHQSELLSDWQRLQAGQRSAANRASEVKVEEIMEHGIYRVESFEIVSPFNLKVRFDD